MIQVRVGKKPDDGPGEVARNISEARFPQPKDSPCGEIPVAMIQQLVILIGGTSWQGLVEATSSKRTDIRCILNKYDAAHKASDRSRLFLCEGHLVSMIIRPLKTYYHSSPRPHPMT